MAIDKKDVQGKILRAFGSLCNAFAGTVPVDKWEEYAEAWILWSIKTIERVTEMYDTQDGETGTPGEGQREEHEGQEERSPDESRTASRVTGELQEIKQLERGGGSVTILSSETGKTVNIWFSERELTPPPLWWKGRTVQVVYERRFSQRRKRYYLAATSITLEQNGDRPQQNNAELDRARRELDFLVQLLAGRMKCNPADVYGLGGKVAPSDFSSQEEIDEFRRVVLRQLSKQ